MGHAPYRQPWPCLDNVIVLGSQKTPRKEGNSAIYGIPVNVWRLRRNSVRIHCEYNSNQILYPVFGGDFYDVSIFSGRVPESEKTTTMKREGRKVSKRKIDRRTFLKIAGVTTGVAVGGGVAAHVGLDDSLLLGLWRYLLPIPRPIWQSQVRGDSDLDFMSEDHHAVRDFSVLELPRVGEPLTPEFIAQELGLTLPRVTGILDDMEAHMTFLFRNERGAVTWAYPVTVDHTPHHVTFSTGEQVYAA
jgi:hypothetical protein